MAKALEAFVELSEDEELKAFEEAKEIQDVKFANQMAYAVDKAREEKDEAALKMIQKGLDLKTISDITGLSEKEIKKLSKQ